MKCTGLRNNNKQGVLTVELTDSAWKFQGKERIQNIEGHGWQIQNIAGYTITKQVRPVVRFATEKK